MRKSNPLRYLDEDGERVGKSLSMTAENYADWSQDQVFESTKKVLDGVRMHLEKETIVLSNLKNNDGLEDYLKEVATQELKLNDEIDNLVMIHVDEPGFEQGLESISAKFQQYCNFCATKLHPSVKQKLTDADLEHISQQLDQSTWLYLQGDQL